MEWFDYVWRIGLVPAVIIQLLREYESVWKARASVTTKIGQHDDPPAPSGAFSGIAGTSENHYATQGTAHEVATEIRSRNVYLQLASGHPVRR